jgi:hypothetical protein
VTPEPQIIIQDRAGFNHVLASCDRCGALVLEEQADKHAEWHRMSPLSTFFGGGL